MRYTLELDSPDMAAFMGAVGGMVVHVAVEHQAVVHRYGRGSQQAILAGRIENCMLRAQAALSKAIAEATPERSTGTYEAHGGTLQSGDEMPLVYGKPRSDPRDARRKNSNTRRKK